MTEKVTQFYWNGERVKGRVVNVEIAQSPKASWWCAGLVGKKMQAIEIDDGNSVFYLANDDASGWRKTTIGLGHPRYMHKGLPDNCVVLNEVPDAKVNK